MQYVAVLLVAAAVFGCCYLFDKGFQKLFRNQAQHHSGLAVRINKRYGAFGAVFCTLGTAAILAGIGSKWILIAGGVLILLVGVGLILYYATFGVFYDEESFILTTFARKSVTYKFKDIKAQQLLNASGNIVIELHMTDGRAVSLQSSMVGVYDFLDTAFDGWCRQRCKDPASCTFHKPEESLWFPNVEDV